MKYFEMFIACLPQTERVIIIIAIVFNISMRFTRRITNVDNIYKS